MFVQGGIAPIDVLIADDDPQTRRVFRLILEGRGLACAEAADGREAVALASRAAPRCVLLDVAMPVMGGLAAARLLRRDPRTRSARLCCVSGLADAWTRAEALGAGCERFLEKPVDAARLLDAVGFAPAAPAAPARREGRVCGLSWGEAESLLDWREAQGCAGLSLELEAGGAAVRFLCPPGLYLAGDGDQVRLVRA